MYLYLYLHKNMYLCLFLSLKRSIIKGSDFTHKAENWPNAHFDILRIAQIFAYLANPEKMDQFFNKVIENFAPFDVGQI